MKIQSLADLFIRVKRSFFNSHKTLLTIEYLLFIYVCLFILFISFHFNPAPYPFLYLLFRREAERRRQAEIERQLQKQREAEEQRRLAEEKRRAAR